MTKDTIVVNLLGGAGIGKSTMAAKVYAQLKDAGVNCELAREVMKDAIWEENNSIMTDELKIFADQNHILRRLQGKVEVVITDAPLYLKLFYQPVEFKFRDLVLEVAAQYNNLNFFLRRVGPYNSVSRFQTEEQAIYDDKLMHNLFTSFHLPLISVSSSSEGAKQVTEYVLNELKRVEAK